MPKGRRQKRKGGGAAAQLRCAERAARAGRLEEAERACDRVAALLDVPALSPEAEDALRAELKQRLAALVAARKAAP